MSLFCKSVLSGDSLVLLVPVQGGPPVEKVMQLSSLSAPRMGSKKQGSDNEPFAYDAKEFLRRLCVGKQLKFKSEYTNPTSKREFGQVFLPTGELVNSIVVSKGWAKVRTTPGKEENRSEATEELVQMEQAAEAAGLGMYTKDPAEIAASRRGVKTVSDAEGPALFETLKGKPHSCVVEHCRTGSNLKVITPDMHEIQVTLSGVQCPGFKRVEGQGEIAEPFAKEAKYFTEVRILQRDVTVLFEGLDKFNNFFGSVTMGAGNIGVEILKAGMGKIVDWSINKSIHVTALRQAEQAAKMQRLRLWKDYVPPIVDPVNPNLAITGQKEFVGKVIQVVSGDTLVVLDNNNRERRITLSSVRAPRLGNARREAKDEPYAAEGRELLRSKLIGKKVNVTIDFKRADPSNPDSIRECATVKLGKTNFAEELIRRGFATAFKHRQDDNDRSSEYDLLCEAEQKAMKNKAGIHSGTEPPANRINDITGNPTKAKQFLPSLQRMGLTPGIVEFISNGARYKVFIPKESCMISFVLGGVKCPQTARNDGSSAGEPFGPESLAFARELCNQRDVEIEVEGVDKGGNFLGTLFVDKENISVQLLERGLGSLNFSADRSPHANKLFAAEELAKNARIGVWQNYVETAGPTEEELAVQRKTKEPEYVKVLVTEVSGDGTFYIQDLRDNDKTSIETKMASLTLGAMSGSVAEPKRGMMVAAPFDGAVYRAKIDEVSKDGKQVCVNFVDYGNKDVVSVADLRPLDASVSGARPLAHECGLAYVKFPKEDNEFLQDSIATFTDFVLNKELLALIEYRDGQRLVVTLFDGDFPTSINMKMLKAGLCLVERRREKYLAETIAALRAVQDEAQRGRLMMWSYGDCESDEEDGRRGGAWGRK